MCFGNPKDLAEVAALVCAAFFFGYKAYTGYLVTNLSLAVQCQRQKSRCGGLDHLAVNVTIRKGANASLTLHDVQARISYANEVEVFPIVGFERCDWRPNGFRSRLDWSQTRSSSPLMRLVPGEETQLSVHCEVPSKAACLVEVAVLGQRTRHSRFGQWRASNVSLPLAEPTTEAEADPG